MHFHKGIGLCARHMLITHTRLLLKRAVIRNRKFSENDKSVKKIK
jgi:hypothetical protein